MGKQYSIARMAAAMITVAMAIPESKVPEANRPQGSAEGVAAPIDPERRYGGPSKGFYGGYNGINQRQRRKRMAQVRGG